MIIGLDGIAKMDTWLDDNVSGDYKTQPLAQDWARVCKVAEELGETVQCLIGATGQNPRKGFVNDMDDMLDEMADTLITGILCIQHFTKDENQTETLIQDRWIYRMNKAGL
jgi:hypothetical protein